MSYCFNICKINLYPTVITYFLYQRYLLYFSILKCLIIWILRLCFYIFKSFILFASFNCKAFNFDRILFTPDKFSYPRALTLFELKNLLNVHRFFFNDVKNTVIPIAYTYCYISWTFLILILYLLYFSTLKYILLGT